MTLHSRDCSTPFTRHLNAFTTMTTSLQLPTTAQVQAVTRAVWNHDYGANLRTISRGLAIAIAVTYVAGMALGSFVHQCNEQLRRFTAQFHEPAWHEQRLLEVRQRIANSITARETTPVAPAAEPVAEPVAAKPARKRAARKPASSMPAAAKPAAAKPVSTSVSTRKRTAPGASRTSPAKGFANA
jgi:H+/gluconate symporter-like permease